MISSQDCYAVLESNFERNKKSYGLNRVVTSVNVVAHEQVVCVWTLTSNFEKFH